MYQMIANHKQFNRFREAADNGAGSFQDKPGNMIRWDHLRSCKRIAGHGLIINIDEWVRMVDRSGLLQPVIQVITGLNWTFCAVGKDDHLGGV